MVNVMEEGRKRVLGIMPSILVARHLKDDGGPAGQPARSAN